MSVATMTKANEIVSGTPIATPTRNPGGGFKEMRTLLLSNDADVAHVLWCADQHKRKQKIADWPQM
jgi:hypothetical protein